MKFILDKKTVQLKKPSSEIVELDHLIQNLDECEFIIEHDHPQGLRIDFLFSNDSGTSLQYPFADVESGASYAFELLDDVKHLAFTKVEVISKLDITVTLSITLKSVGTLN